MTGPSHAVFLSYASQDAPAAQRIAEALRAAGIEVWFDRQELRGGDAWDRQIRQQIHDCGLFIPVISAHTEARDEGYFRREWKLAVDRTHDMAEDKAFVVPVAIDGTTERSARVPDTFRHVQWTRLPGGETPATFVARLRRLLSPELAAPIRELATARSGAIGTLRAPEPTTWSPRRAGSPSTASETSKARAPHAKFMKTLVSGVWRWCTTSSDAMPTPKPNSKRSWPRSVMPMRISTPRSTRMGRSPHGARVARNRDARARSGTLSPEGRPAYGSAASGAALPGRHAGV